MPAQADLSASHGDRADIRSYCHGLLSPPLESDTLEVWLLLTRTRIQRTAARRILRRTTRAWRTNRARHAAQVRWAARGASTQ